MNISMEKTPSMLFSKSLVHLKQIPLIQKDIVKIDGIQKESLKINYLNSSYVLHLVARWEVFIEELVEYCVRKLEERNGSNHLSKNDILQIKAKTKGFHSPKTQNIDKLFEETLGIEKITMSWQSEDLTREQATSTLYFLITARNEIAHTGTTSKQLSYSENFDRMETLLVMAKLMEDWLIKELGF